MHWTVEGAADIIALRCQRASGRWVSYGQPAPLHGRAARCRLTDTATQNRRRNRPR